MSIGAPGASSLRVASALPVKATPRTLHSERAAQYNDANALGLDMSEPQVAAAALCERTKDEMTSPITG